MSIQIFTRTLMVLLVVLFFNPAKAALIPSVPDIAARGYLVMDAGTGTVIAESNSDERLPPASLTKMMTSYVLAYELAKGNISTDDLVLISENAWRMGGSRMFVREGTQVRLGDLMKGIIIQSGNDASVAVAEHIAGSETAFADLMNQHAHLLGMDNSHFVNATGLPAEEHYATAHDLAKLANALINRYPEHYGIYSEKYFTYNKIRQPNRNKLLWRDKTVDGIKTGHTEAAGYCLVASAERDNMRLITVVMGTSSEEARAQESQKLLSYGFRYYRTQPLYKAGESLSVSDVWGGEVDSLRVGVSEPLAVTTPRGQQDQLDAVMDINRVIKAPVSKGDVLGSVSVKLNGELLTEVPLVALDDIAEAGMLKQLWHAVLLFFKGLISG